MGSLRIVYVPGADFAAWAHKELLLEDTVGTNGWTPERWRSHFVDRPMVEYAEVYRERDRRRGFATAMYVEAARWMGALGLPLRSSLARHQSPDSKALWASLSSRYATREVGVGGDRVFYLDLGPANSKWGQRP